MPLSRKDRRTQDYRRQLWHRRARCLRAADLDANLDATLGANPGATLGARIASITPLASSTKPYDPDLRSCPSPQLGVMSRPKRCHDQNGFLFAKALYARLASLSAGTRRASSRPDKPPAANALLAPPPRPC